MHLPLSVFLWQPGGSSTALEDPDWEDEDETLLGPAVGPRPRGSRSRPCMYDELLDLDEDLLDDEGMDDMFSADLADSLVRK